MTNYYLPENYPDTEKGARLYIKDIRASDKEKEDIRLTIKAVRLIINYNKSNDIQPILNILNPEAEDSNNDGAMLFSIDLWDRFTSDLRASIKKEHAQRQEQIESPKKPIKLNEDDGQYHPKYYLPESYPDNAEGVKKYFSDLIRNAVTNEKAKTELMLTTRVLRLIENYHTYKEKEPLEDAIRDSPELFQLEMFRMFVADVNSNEYKPKKSGYRHRATEEKHKSVVAHVEYYNNMGFPIYYESSKPNRLNASQLTADRMSIAKTSVEEIYKNKNNNNGSTAFVRSTKYNSYDDRLFSWHGQAIWVLNGFRKPESEEKIEQLEKILLSLPTREELRKVERFSRGYNTRKTKLPTTEKELRRIKEILSKRENYDFVKSLQIREISLKT